MLSRPSSAYRIFWLIVAVQSFSCPTGWYYVVSSNSCLQVFTGLNLDFQGAETFCIGQSGQLASISDQYDDAFIISQFNATTGVIWVGGYSNKTGNGWTPYQWLDSTTWTSFDQTLWLPGEPDHFGGIQDTTVLSTNGLMDDIYHATMLTGVACEIAIPPLVSCCPTDGVWSQWSATTKCNDTCGLFGVQSFSRSCYSAAQGCPCSGNATATIACNPLFCNYPRDTCNKPFKTMKVSGKNVCGPLPTLPV